MTIAGKRILVTGGAGVVGSTIVDHLVRGGAAEVVVLDQFSRGRLANLAWAQENGPVTVIPADLRDTKQLAVAMCGMDLVMHQAAIRITQCAEEPRLALEVMVDATFNVLEAAVSAGVEKVVAASSAAVYGMAEQFPTPEGHHLYANRTLDEVCKVASGTETSLNELARALARAMGSDLVPEYGPERSVNPVPRRVGDPSRALEKLGFRTEIDLDEGLRRLVEWWRAERVAAE